VASGRQLILLSRRPVERIEERLPADLFAVVVAEYGAVLYWPATGQARRLAEPLPPELTEHPALRNAEPRAVGDVVFTVGANHENALRTALEDVGAEVKVIADKDLLVAAPPGPASPVPPAPKFATSPRSTRSWDPCKAKAMRCGARCPSCPVT